MHKAIRSKQLNLYQTFMQAQQIGGRQGVPVTLGSHQVRAFQRLCCRLKQPSALLFIDLQEAFYRVIRPLVVDGPIDDEMIASMAARIDLDDGFLHDLQDALRQPCALEEAGVPLHLRRAIRALHTDTFFKLPTQQDQVLTHIGTRPGDSFADVIFGYMMAKVLHKFQADMDALGLLMRIPMEEAFGRETSPPKARFPFVGPCWMDDLCVCLTATSNTGLEQALGTATGAILDTFKSFAMTPNLQPGKNRYCGHPTRNGHSQLEETLVWTFHGWALLLHWRASLVSSTSGDRIYSLGRQGPLLQHGEERNQISLGSSPPGVQQTQKTSLPKCELRHG